MNLDIILHSLLQGLIYSLVVMGVYLTSRIIKFDDLTCEGSFSLGGAVTAVLLVTGSSPGMAFVAAIISGAIAGLLTALLHTKLKMNNLISGLVVTTGLFSICLKAAGANVVLPQESSLFADLSSLQTLWWLSAIVLSAYVAIEVLLRSEIGLLLKCVGTNPQMLTSLGKHVDGYKMVGLASANALTALAGSCFVQFNGFYSITGSVGTLVIGLAGLILAEVIKPAFSLAIILGAIAYQAIFAVTIELELDPVWNNLIKATLIVLLIQLGRKKGEKLCCD